MTETVDGLLKQYEGGTLGRRELLAAIAVLITPQNTLAQSSTLQARSFNHLNIRVADVGRSEAFYRKVLGFSAVRPVVGAAFALDFPGGGFISLCPLSVPSCGVKSNAQRGDIDHFGIGIDNFDATRLESDLKAAGLQGVRNAGTSVFFTDPDGVSIQLSAAGQSYAARP